MIAKLATAVFLLAEVALVGPSQGIQTLPSDQPALAKPQTKKPELKQLSASEKGERAKKQLNLKSAPKKTLDALVLSVRKPFVQGAGGLHFYDCSIVNCEDEGTGFAEIQVPPSFARVDAHFTVHRPKLLHVVTFYVGCRTAQEVVITRSKIGGKPDFQTVTFDVPKGEQTISYAFIPGKAGEHYIRLQPKEVPPYIMTVTFYKVEFDVME